MQKITFSLTRDLLLTLLFLFLSFLGYSQSQTFNDPTKNSTPTNTFTVPAGVTQVTVEAWGGGGRGGSASDNGYTRSGGGGGGGAYSKKVITVTPGNTYTIVVGLGGSDTNLNGGQSTFDSTVVVAEGGKGVATNTLTGGIGGIWNSANGDSGFSGGNGADGIITTKNYGGGGGSSAGTAANGNSGNTSTGGIAPAGGGAGGNGSTNNGSSGANGAGIGGGGGGATKGTGNAIPLGGTGNNGQVIISWTTLSLTNGPGGVTSNLQLWLRADLLNGTTSFADNTNVSTWSTQAYGSNAVKPPYVGAPVYKNNISANINFNAVVDFTNNFNTTPKVFTDNDPNRQYLKGTSGFYSQDMFVVLIPDITITSAVKSNDIFCGDRDPQRAETDATGLGYGAYTERFNSEALTYAVGTSNGINSGYGVSDSKPGSTYSTPGIINARNTTSLKDTDLSFNANDVKSATSDLPAFVNVSNSQYWIGRSEGWDGSLDARVAEIITLDSRASDSDRNKILSYLAIKYGITLCVNGTSMNYTNSSGSVIWNQVSNVGFNYNITGIGRDDLSKLSQKQSKTVNTIDDVTIGLTDIYTINTANTNAFDTDKKFLVWGNNNGTLAAQSPVVVNISSGITPTLTSDVSFISIGRTWKVVETGGDVSSVKVSIPTMMLSATLTPPGDYLMFISNTPTFDPTSEYRVMKENGTNLETNYDFNGSKYITFGFAPEKTFERSIKFNGTTDFMDAGKVLNLNTSFTVSAWVNRSTTTNRTILSKRNSTFTEGYDLGINAAGKAEMSWMVGVTKYTITSNVVIPQDKWHHIAVIYDGTKATIYIDGITLASTAKTLPTVPATTQSFLIAAADGVTPTSYFKGSIDEVRVWKVALTPAQLRYVMNQEILNNTAFTNGAIIPNTITKNDISSMPWTDLSVYYPMSTYTYTNAKDISSNNYTAALRNLKTVDRQTAPLPYLSQADGMWESAGTWLNNAVQDLPNSLSIEDNSKTIDWNIIKTNHNIISTGNKTALGLFVNSNTVTATNDTKIEVSHYLKLDGKIDLQGMSQLLQTTDSELDPTSKGSIERDQQGQLNKYNYNYWSSPVSPINPIANNSNYTVKGVMKDGATSTPIDIKFIDGYDGTTTPTLSLARYWLNKFESNTDAYANWIKFTENDDLKVGQGFTLKGAGAVGGATLNYTFVGKPNNGKITNYVGPNQLLLIGNPYPSALDAYKFLDDNLAVNQSTTDGTLYFWQHAPENNTHILANYLGSYGVLNRAGGVPAMVTPDLITGGGTSSRRPNRYIPVGQGFFVYGTPFGGAVEFNNSQRAFFKENDGLSNSLFRKKELGKVVRTQEPVEETYKKIRLGYNTINGYHRQVLLAFMDDKATSALDYGYDSEIMDDFPNDMYLLSSETELAIQGEGYFDENASFPIGVRIETAGKVSFGVDALENFDTNQSVYIYDAETDIHHPINDALFEIEYKRNCK